MDALGAEHQRRLDIVIHDEGHAVPGTEAPRGTPALDDVDSRDVLQAPLHDRRSAFRSEAGRFEVSNDRMELHSILTRESSVSGSRAASASYRPTWKEPGPLASRAASSPATPNAASASAAASNGPSPFTARKQAVIALDMQPVPDTAASSSCPFATARTLSPSDT